MNSVIGETARGPAARSGDRAYGAMGKVVLAAMAVLTAAALMFSVASAYGLGQSKRLTLGGPEPARSAEQRNYTTGNAYAVITDTGELVFFRSTGSYEHESVGTFSDIKGGTYTGRVFANVESASFTGWEGSAYGADVKSVRVADGQGIVPVGMYRWFRDCTNMVTFSGNGFDTSNVTDMRQTFARCSSLETLDISAFDCTNVTRTLNLVNNCTSLSKVVLSDTFKFEGAVLPTPPSDDGVHTGRWTNGTVAFSSADLSAQYNGATMAGEWVWETKDNQIRDYTTGYAYAVLQDDGEMIFFRSNEYYTNSFSNSGAVVDIEGNEYTGTVFVGVEASQGASWQESFSTLLDRIKSVRVADGQGIRPQLMRRWFEYCSNLVSFDGRGFDTSRVADMARLFAYCASLEFADLVDFGSVKKSDMFVGCSRLSKVVLGETFRFTYVWWGGQVVGVLPNPPSDDGVHTGKWTNGRLALTADELAEQYDGTSSMVGEWEWEKSAPREVPDGFLQIANEVSDNSDEKAVSLGNQLFKFRVTFDEPVANDARFFVSSTNVRPTGDASAEVNHATSPYVFAGAASLGVEPAFALFQNVESSEEVDENGDGESDRNCPCILDWPASSQAVDSGFFDNVDVCFFQLATGTKQSVLLNSEFVDDNKVFTSAQRNALLTDGMSSGAGSLPFGELFGNDGPTPSDLYQYALDCGLTPYDMQSVESNSPDPGWHTFATLAPGLYLVTPSIDSAFGEGGIGNEDVSFEPFVVLVRNPAVSGLPITEKTAPWYSWSRLVEGAIVVDDNTVEFFLDGDLHNLMSVSNIPSGVGYVVEELGPVGEEDGLRPDFPPNSVGDGPPADAQNWSIESKVFESGNTGTLDNPVQATFTNLYKVASSADGGGKDGVLQVVKEISESSDEKDVFLGFQRFKFRVTFDEPVADSVAAFVSSSHIGTLHSTGVTTPAARRIEAKGTFNGFGVSEKSVFEFFNQISPQIANSDYSLKLDFVHQAFDENSHQVVQTPYPGIECSLYQLATGTSDSVMLNSRVVGEAEDGLFTSEQQVLLAGGTNGLDFSEVFETSPDMFTMAQYLVDNGVRPYDTQTSGPEGLVDFGEVPAGLYLVVQSGSAGVGNDVVFDPFIAALPNLLDGADSDVRALVPAYTSSNFEDRITVVDQYTIEFYLNGFGDNVMTFSDMPSGVGYTVEELGPVGNEDGTWADEGAPPDEGDDLPPGPSSNDDPPEDAENWILESSSNTSGATAVGDASPVATFMNVYKMGASSDTVRVVAKKELTGRDLQDKEFEFEFLTGPIYDIAEVVATAKNDAQGNIVFDMDPSVLVRYNENGLPESAFPMPGEHIVVGWIREKAGNEEGMTYDDAVYQVEMVVGEGSAIIHGSPLSDYDLQPANYSNLVFRNEYVVQEEPMQPGNGRLKVSKQVTDSPEADPDQEFEFELEKVEYEYGAYLHSTGGADSDIADIGLYNTFFKKDSAHYGEGSVLDADALQEVENGGGVRLRLVTLNADSPSDLERIANEPIEMWKVFDYADGGLVVHGDFAYMLSSEMNAKLANIGQLSGNLEYWREEFSPLKLDDNLKRGIEQEGFPADCMTMYDSAGIAEFNYVEYGIYMAKTPLNWQYVLVSPQPVDDGWAESIDVVSTMLREPPADLTKFVKSRTTETFRLKAGESREFNIPAGVEYTVREVVDNGWEVDSSTNTTGVVQEGATVESAWVNRQKQTAPVLLPYTGGPGLSLCVGIGFVLLFGYGAVKVREWRNRRFGGVSVKPCC